VAFPVRQAVVRLHRWVGLALAAYVALLCLTGSVLVYRPELYRHFEPQPLEVPVGARLLSDDQLLTHAAAAFPDALPLEVWRGREPHHAVEVNLERGSETQGHLFDPYTGEALGHPLPLGFRAVTWLLDLHTQLLGGPDGRWVNGALALGLVFLALSGALAWRPRRRKRQTSSPTNRPGALRRLHMTAGIGAAIFVLLWGVSGAALAWPEATMTVVDTFEPFDETSLEERVGDKVSYWLAYWHFGRFGGRLPRCERLSACDETLKAAWSLIALVPVFLAASGALLWLRRRRPRRSTDRR
jgi:uncharacterized iron-regulated membrane protein